MLETQTGDGGLAECLMPNRYTEPSGLLLMLLVVVLLQWLLLLYVWIKLLKTIASQARASLPVFYALLRMDRDPENEDILNNCC